MKELLFSVTRKDLEIKYFNGTGNGGSNRNKVAVCVHMKHIDSGVSVSAQRERSREQNLRSAFKKLTEDKKFKTWSRIKAAEAMQTKADKEWERLRIEEMVDEAMRPENIKFEVKDDKGGWVAAGFDDPIFNNPDNET